MFNFRALGVFKAVTNDQRICAHHQRDCQNDQVFHFIFAFFVLGESGEPAPLSHSCILDTHAPSGHNDNQSQLLRVEDGPAGRG